MAATPVQIEGEARGQVLRLESRSPDRPRPRGGFPVGAGNGPTGLSHGLRRRYLLPFDTAVLPERRCDVLVVGSGIAGLVAALLASESASVALAAKASVAETNTRYAQGGIAGAITASDSAELHLADTLAAGAGLCDEQIARTVAEEAPEAIELLKHYGVRFDVGVGGRPDLHLEGGHTHPRVLHA
ncbi:MAG: FAD-binding protein, partial [Deltaproteobacteria bacterium]|nr:FAD-binding protein [Deltaproteobacteria bacterium]